MASGVINRIQRQFQRITNEYTENDIIAWRVGDMVKLNIDGLKDIPVRTSVSIGFLSEGFRPTNLSVTTNVTLSPNTSSSTVARETYRIKITTNGEITIFAYNDVILIGNLVTSIVYPA